MPRLAPINPILTGKWGNLVKSTLQVHACQIISASVDGGLSGVSRVRGHGSEDPHRR